MVFLENDIERESGNSVNQRLDVGKIVWFQDKTDLATV